MGERLGASYGPKSSGSLKTFRNEPIGSRPEPRPTGSGSINNSFVARARRARPGPTSSL